MNKFYSLLLVLGLASIVSAANTVHVITPGDLATNSAEFATGIVGWDWDEVAPTGVADPTAPIGSGAFYADVQGSAAGGPVDYTAIRINTSNLFGYAITAGQLANLTYSTNFVGGTVDWQVKVYTAPTPTSTSWYASRANYNRGNDLNDGWDTYSINSLGLSYMTDKDPVSLYADETIMFIDIIAGYATSSPPSQSYLDNVTLLDINGESHTLDLEASAVVPAPGAILLAGLGTSLVGGLRRRMR